jgi:hypothetical protein
MAAGSFQRRDTSFEGEVDIEDRCSFGGERLHQVATGPRISGIRVDRRKGDTYVMKLSSASCSFPTRIGIRIRTCTISFLVLGEPKLIHSILRSIQITFLGW